MLDFRTDLADERIEILRGKTKDYIDGIEVVNSNPYNNISISTVHVTNEHGSIAIDKKIGSYITINIDDIEHISNVEIKNAIEVFSKTLKSLTSNYNSFLVVGLGNENTTADAIGPNAVKDLAITRHILQYKPELLPPNSKSVSALAPGVLGTTGIETQEIIKAVVDKVSFDAIIAIDALSSNNISRLLHTIQICNTGIIPGSGVQNKRAEISFETMGIPVIAVGVPTVVDAATIVANTFDILVKDFSEFSFLKDSDYSDKYKLIKMVLEPSNYNLAVMPKEIDYLAENLQEIISSGINKSFN